MIKREWKVRTSFLVILLCAIMLSFGAVAVAHEDEGHTHEERHIEQQLDNQASAPTSNPEKGWGSLLLPVVGLLFSSGILAFIGFRLIRR